MIRREVVWRDDKSTAVVDPRLTVHAVTRDVDWDVMTMCGRYLDTPLVNGEWHLTWAPVTCMVCLAEES